MSFPFPCFLSCPDVLQVENRKIPPAVSGQPGARLGEFWLVFFFSRCMKTMEIEITVNQWYKILLLQTGSYRRSFVVCCYLPIVAKLHISNRYEVVLAQPLPRIDAS